MTKCGKPLVTFTPGGAVEADMGDTLLDAALENGIALPHECGGNCACTTCHVYVDVLDALTPVEEVEIDRLSDADGRQSNSRLACQAILSGGDITVTIVEPYE